MKRLWIAAAALLTVVSFNTLFLGTVVGFVASALLVVSVLLPSPRPSAPRGIYDRTTRGMRIYLKTPRLQGLLALTFAVSAAGSMVIVNTVVLVQSVFGLEQQQTALALAAFGTGSMAAAFALPKLPDRFADRPVMSFGAGILTTAMLAGSVLPFYVPLLALWVVVGIGYSVKISIEACSIALHCALARRLSAKEPRV